MLPPEPCRSLPDDLSPDRRIALETVPTAGEILPAFKAAATTAGDRLDRVLPEPLVEVLVRPLVRRIDDLRLVLLSALVPAG